MHKYKLISVLGGPASGKGTLCSKLTNNFKSIVHISAGDVIRSQKNLAPEFIDMMKNGSILPAQFVGNLIIQYIKENYDTDKIILLDGFPRDQANYDYFCTEMSKYFDLICILVIESSNCTMIERTMSRGKLSGRADDTVETCLKRIESYYNETNKIIDLFDSVLIKRVSGEIEHENKTYDEVVKHLNLSNE